MALCIAKPNNNKRCRKRFVANRDDSDYHIADWSIHKKLSYDAIKQSELVKVIRSCQSGKFAVFQTLPDGDSNTSFVASTANCPMTPTNLLCLDVDCYASPCSAADCIRKRYDLVRRELSLLLEGVAATVQLSAKAGLDYYYKGKKRYESTERLSIRVFIQADEAMTLEDWWELLEPYARIREDSAFYDDSGYYFDKNCFRPTQPLWLGIPDDESTDRSDLALDEIYTVEGSLLNTQPLRDFKPTVERPSRKSKKPADGVLIDKIDARTAVWNLDYEDMLPTLNGMDWDGKGARNAILTNVFRRIAQTRITDLEPAARAIFKHYKNLWDADWGDDEVKAKHNLKRRIFRAKEYMTQLYLGSSQSVRQNNQWFEMELAGKDVPTDLFDNLGDRYEVVVAVDCGGGKSESIKKISADAYESGESVIFLAPYLVNVYGIANETVMTHYHSIGTDTHSKRAYANKEHPQQSWCWKSVNSIPPEQRCFDILVFDECIEALLEWKKSPHTMHCWGVIEDLVRNANKIIWLDADFTDEFGLAFVSRLTANQERKRYLVESPHSYAEGMHYHLFRTLNETVFWAIEAINEGQRVVINVDWANTDSTTKQWTGSLLAFHNLIKAYCPDKRGIAFDSSDCPQALRDSFGNYMHTLVTDGFDYVILSPLAPKGASYLPADVADDFDLEVSLLKARHSDAYKAYQTSRRCRRTANHLIYLNSSYDPAADAFFWEQIQKNGHLNRALTQDEFNYTLMNIEEARRKSNPFDQLLVKLWRVGASVHLDSLYCKEDVEIAHLQKTWSKLKKEAKAEYESEREELVKCLRTWQFIDTDENGNKIYRHFRKGDTLSDAEQKKLLKRYRYLKNEHYQSMLETLLSPKYQRDIWSEDHTARTKQYRKAIGAVTDKIQASIEASFDSQELLLELLTNPNVTKIDIDISKIEAEPILKLINQYWRELKQANVAPTADAKNDIVAAIKWLAKLLDCSVEDDVGNKQLKWEQCRDEATETMPETFPRGLGKNAGFALMTAYIEEAKATNTPLTTKQQEWWITRKNVIAIVKPHFVSDLVFDEVKRYLTPPVDSDFIDSVLGVAENFDNAEEETIYDLV